MKLNGIFNEFREWEKAFCMAASNSELGKLTPNQIMSLSPEDFKRSIFEELINRLKDDE